MKQFLSAGRLILSSIGIDILELKKVIYKQKSTKKEIIFTFKIKKVK